MEIAKLDAILTGELAERGEWVIANIEPQMSWPVAAQKAHYRGIDVWVLPVTDGHFPAVAVNKPTAMSTPDAERLLMRFLSSLAWIERAGILVEFFDGGPVLRPATRIRKQFGYGVQRDLDLSYLPEPTDESAQLALALIREGRGLNHAAYAFLTFYKVLEVAIEGRHRGAWINGHVDHLSSSRAKEMLAQLKSRGVTDVGKHLYTSGRHAIAHAREKPIIDPDDPAETRRLDSELPIMDGLAELAIEDCFGVETRSTVWSNHLYELAGFKEILAPEIVAMLAKGEIIQKPCGVTMPPLAIELRTQQPYPVLAKLLPVAMEQAGCGLWLTLVSEHKDAAMRLFLDFQNERLEFDIGSGLQGHDDGTPEGAERMASLERFVRDYLGNGELRVLNAATRKLISRKDAFIPVNCFVNTEGCNARIAKWLEHARVRRASA